MTRPSAVFDGLVAFIEALEPATDTDYAVSRSRGDRFRRYTGDLDGFNRERGFILELTEAPAMDPDMPMCSMRIMGLSVLVSYAYTASVYQRILDDAAILEPALRALNASDVAGVMYTEVGPELPVTSDPAGKRVLLEIPIRLTYE